MSCLEGRLSDATWAQSSLLHEMDTAVLGYAWSTVNRFILGRQKVKHVAMSADVTIDMATGHWRKLLLVTCMTSENCKWKLVEETE